MSRCLFTIICGALLLCPACTRQHLDTQPELFSVTFVLDGGSVGGSSTRATAVADEESVAEACLYFVNSSGVVIDAVSSSEKTILRNFETGTYKAYYVANSGLEVNSFTSESEISSYVLSLASQTGSFSMFAYKSFRVPEDRICTITAERLVSKVEIDKISVDFSQYPDLSAQTFTIDSIYLINVAGESVLADGTTFLPATSSWINKRSYVPGTYDALLCDAVGRTVTASSPHSSAHYFYCFQNNASADSHSEGWDARYTRLVIACTIGTTKTYYPINIVGPGGRLSRNCRYIISELIITDIGNRGPDEELTGSMPYRFSSDVMTWEGTHTISERF